jgi:predicted phage tail protein
MSHRINATFRSQVTAEAVLLELERMGVNERQISALMSDTSRGKVFNIESHTKAAEGTSIGAATGGVIGIILGGLATATALAIPGLNIVVSGALVSALAGLGAGAATGGLIGGLVGAGMTEHEAKLYENEIKDGAILISVDAVDSEQKDKINEIFKRQNAHNIAA